MPHCDIPYWDEHRQEKFKLLMDNNQIRFKGLYDAEPSQQEQIGQLKKRIEALENNIPKTSAIIFIPTSKYELDYAMRLISKQK